MKKIRIDSNVNNSEFVISLKIMQGNLTPDTQKDFINQMIHAKFLCPVLFDPEPEINEEDGMAVLADGAKVMLSSLTNPKKELYLIAYTDNQEAVRHKHTENQHTIECTYFDFCSMILKEDAPYAGFVINPFSENVIVGKQIMQNINKNIHVRKPAGARNEDITHNN